MTSRSLTMQIFTVILIGNSLYCEKLASLDTIRLMEDIPSWVLPPACPRRPIDASAPYFPARLNH
jgi:hypothetical protein